MYLKTATVVALLATFANAWRAGFWASGKSLQVHGTAWPVCNNINPITVGEVTFDTVTDNFPDPSRICLYSTPDCSGTLIHCMGKSLTGVRARPGGTARSYKIGQ
ncbi:hypothetical protein HJFPF1_08228 [Paramyrothecium foliicola]|nr:hypothetical protein HJFPF1_08228 [Paramyrothecium foliicola]